MERRTTLVALFATLLAAHFASGIPNEVTDSLSPLPAGGILTLSVSARAPPPPGT